MNKYDLNAHLEDIYAHFPEAEDRPVIGITANYDDLSSKLSEGYYKTVIAAGGVPLIIPPSTDRNVIIGTLKRIDALLLSGGADINPLYCGEEPSPHLGGINSERDLPELLITRLAYNRQLPILGICRGIQTLAVALGGKVMQDIASEQDRVEGEKLVAAVKHSQNAPRSEHTHSVAVTADSILASLYGQQASANGHQATGTSQLFVNSFHHQAVSDPGAKFRVTARAADGIIEAIESSEFRSVLGVQWHPECLDDGLPIFQWLVREAAAYRAAHRLHDRILTLDTHCDTPMFFPEGIRFDHRDSRILVDLHKMTEGRQDATIMVAYLPQPQPGERFADKVAFSVDGPAAYADLIFDKIEEIVRANSSYLALARTPDDLWANKRLGRKSIMLGIENGVALEGRLDRLVHFADRGMVYMTLCHNGDNDICDSARGTHTHNGLSAFGREVVGEMNRLGILVDLSHAAEKSFYDAIEVSRQPIVCSHSSCRALCDHPRNLTDDQMRALAAHGGVMQVTLYNGFLRTDGHATIVDAMAHVEHAVGIMGIDHVGLGTDFDGDGGVPGLADSSELLNYTRELLSRRFSASDIQRLWGGNFLRVMSQVQSSKH